MECPACGLPMVSRRADQVAYDGCDACGGVWVEALKSLQLWAAFAAAREPLPATPDGAVGLRAEGCGGCGAALEDFRYLESPAVLLQRCNPCRRLWVPGDLQEGARRLWEKRVGREAQRLDRKVAMEAAFRPVVHVVHTQRGVRTLVSGDVDAEREYMAVERRLEAEADDPHRKR